MPSANAPPEAEDLVPADLRAAIELFATQLANVAFPDVDAASLRRAADEVRAEASKIAALRAQLDAALAQSAARVTALSATVARGLAYARIYSDAHPEHTALSAALAALTPALAAPTPAGTGKRRGRPPRRSAELFDEVAPAPAPPPHAAP